MESRQLRVTIDVSYNRTEELSHRITWEQGAKMPAHGREGGDGVVAKCLAVMVGTR